MSDEDIQLPIPIAEIDAAYRERYTELLEIIQPFCETYLNQEYLESCYRLAADVCQEGSPVLSGKAKSWAAGLTWAIGRVNFLSSSEIEPSMSQKEFSAAIGVSSATISAKCREIWEGLELIQLDPDYIVESMAKDTPLSQFAEMISQYTAVFSGLSRIETVNDNETRRGKNK